MKIVSQLPCRRLMKTDNPPQFIVRYLPQIDFIFLLITIIFSLLQVNVIDYLNYSVRWDLTIKFLIWIFFFQSGIDLLIPTLYASADDLKGKIEHENSKKAGGLSYRNKEVIAVILISVSFIPFSHLVSARQSFLWIEFSLLASLISVFLIFREHPTVSRYSELSGSFMATFLVPFLINILHAIPHNRLSTFTSLPFFFFVCVVLIMRNTKNFIYEKSHCQVGLIQWMDIRSIFIMVLALMGAGFMSFLLLPIMGIGISMLPEILVSIAVGFGVFWNLRKIYLENKNRFQDVYILCLILLAINILIFVLKIRIN